MGQYFATALTSALTLAFAFFIGFAGGRWLDQHLHTSPWLTLIGMGLGVTAGFRTVLREIAPDLFTPAKARSGRARPKSGHGGPEAGGKGPERPSDRSSGSDEGKVEGP